MFIRAYMQMDSPVRIDALKGVSPVSLPVKVAPRLRPAQSHSAPALTPAPGRCAPAQGPLRIAGLPFIPEAPGKAFKPALRGPEVRESGGSCLRNRLPGIQVRASLCCRKIPALPYKVSMTMAITTTTDHRGNPAGKRSGACSPISRRTPCYCLSGSGTASSSTSVSAWHGF